MAKNTLYSLKNQEATKLTSGSEICICILMWHCFRWWDGERSGLMLLVWRNSGQQEIQQATITLAKTTSTPTNYPEKNNTIIMRKTWLNKIFKKIKDLSAIKRILALHTDEIKAEQSDWCKETLNSEKSDKAKQSR